MSIVDYRRRLIEKPFFAILLLVLFLLVSILLPRIINPGIGGRINIEYVVVDVSYGWVNNTCLNITINSTRKIFIDKLIIGGEELPIGKEIDNESYRAHVCLGYGLNKTVYGKIYYRVGDHTRYKLFLVKPPAK